MSKITYIKTKKNYKQAYCRYIAYNLCEDEEFCVLLDGDDWLYNKFVLAYLNIFIDLYQVDLTYRNFIYWDGVQEKINNSNGDYSNEVIKNVSYRNDSWRAQHLRVIKAKYLKNIKFKHLLDDSNNFIKCNSDLNESWACLEQCNGKHKMVTEPMMFYNKENALKYDNNYYTESEENKNYRNNLIEKIKTYKYPPYTDKKKKTTVVYIDEPKSYEDFLNNKSMLEEDENNKILCIPSYLQRLYK